MVLGSAIHMTMSSGPVTRNIGRQRVCTVQASHRATRRIGLGCAMRVNLGALYRSAGATDCFHTTRFRRHDRILITASIPLEGQRCLLLCVQPTLRLHRRLGLRVETLRRTVAAWGTYLAPW